MTMRTLALLSPLLFLSATAALAGSGERWGARDPVTSCIKVETDEPPSSDEIVALFRCQNETADASDELWLIEDVALEIGKGREYLGRGEHLQMPDVDTYKPVYPLRGSWTWVVCRIPSAVQYTGGDPSLNCRRTPFGQGTGACWSTTFGDWRCNANGRSGETTHNHPPPR